MQRSAFQVGLVLSSPQQLQRRVLQRVTCLLEVLAIRPLLFFCEWNVVLIIQIVVRRVTLLSGQSEPAYDKPNTERLEAPQQQTRTDAEKQ